ncbi:uncharacterized protein TNCV_883441 [Trichonephila clavipes]|nr:uncharacterized protein TNCV_883441 [Trichonephila clavipes]
MYRSPERLHTRTRLSSVPKTNRCLEIVCGTIATPTSARIVERVTVGSTSACRTFLRSSLLVVFLIAPDPWVPYRVHCSQQFLTAHSERSTWPATLRVDQPAVFIPMIRPLSNSLNYVRGRLFPEGWEKKRNHNLISDLIKKSPRQNVEVGRTPKHERSIEAERRRGEGKKAGRNAGRPKAVTQRRWDEKKDEDCKTKLAAGTVGFETGVSLFTDPISDVVKCI